MLVYIGTSREAAINAAGFFHQYEVPPTQEYSAYAAEWYSVLPSREWRDREDVELIKFYICDPWWVSVIEINLE
jgi:hypothetical protein